MICQPLAAICQVDDAALMKAVFGKAALHGQIDAMGVGAEVGVLLPAPWRVFL